MSRAMMLHFSFDWPQVAETNLWPFAVDHAIYVWNNIPGREVSLCMSPTELLTGIKACTIIICNVFMFLVAQSTY